MAPTPVHNIVCSTPNSIYSPHPKNSLASWFRTFLGSKETGRADSYQLDDLSPVVSEPGLGPTPNTGRVLEQGLPGTPATETFYNSPHHIKGIADWFISLTAGFKKPQQDQGESYELDTLLSWTPTVSRYPPKIPELDLGPAFHVSDIFRRNLQTCQMRCKSILPRL